MSFVYADRVQEVFTTTGTGTISLGGAVTGYQSFGSAMTNGQTCYYAATDGTNWEVGLGTYASSGNTLARTSVLSSSNGGSAVNWSAGTKSIWMDLPAAALPTAAGVTGTGQMVLATSPTLVTPALGTPASGNLSNCTGFPSTGLRGTTAAVVTDTTNISLSLAPTQANVGSSFSLAIPAKGIIWFNASLQATIGGSNAGIIFGLRIGSTNYWPSSNNGVATTYAALIGNMPASTTITASSIAPFGTIATGVGNTTGGNQGMSQTVGLPIEASGIPTSTQTVQTIAAMLSNGSSVTIDGASVTTRVYITAEDHT